MALREKYGSYVFGFSVFSLMICQGAYGLVGWEWLNVPSILAFLVSSLFIFIFGSNIAKTFIYICLSMTIATLLLFENPIHVLWESTRRAMFFQAFLTAVFTLQEPAMASSAIKKIGLYLIQKRSLTRSISILLGTNIMSLMMNIGSVVMVGSIAKSSGNNPEKYVERECYDKQDSLASIRGFAPSSSWSPLALPPVFLSTFYPHVPLSSIIFLGFLVSLFILILSLCVTCFEAWLHKPHFGDSNDFFSEGASPIPVQSFLSLFLILSFIFLSIKSLSILFEISPSTSVMLVIPTLSFLWMLKHNGFKISENFLTQTQEVIVEKIPQQAISTTVIVSAAFIGPILVMLFPFGELGSYFVRYMTSPQMFLACVFLFVIISGMVGFNPVLSVTILISLAGDLSLFGVTQLEFIVTTLGAWSIAAQTSPFTATTIIAGRLFNLSPNEIVFKWNMLHFILSLMVAVVFLYIWF